MRERGPVRALVAAAMLAAPLVLAQGVAAPAAGAAPAGRLIRDIQGAGHVSPLEGTAVAAVPGVVTAVSGNGFWMQDPRPDDDPATSEGIFVFTRTHPRATPGDAVRVNGTVGEFRPGGASSANLSRTEIDATWTRVTAHRAALPAPVHLGPGGRKAPEAVDGGKGGATRDVEAPGGFDPDRDAIDFYESLEGMRVRVVDPVAVGPSLWGEVPVVPSGGRAAGPRTGRGGLLLGARTANTERIVLDDAIVPLPAMNVGDRFPGPHDGVLDYGHGAFTLLLTAAPRRQGAALARERARPAARHELAVATANLGGLSPESPASRYAALAGDLVSGLGSPDLVMVTGLRDNSGPGDDGTVAADQTVAELITAVSAAGGPAYDWRSVEPADNADGGWTGTNDRVGFLFRTDRGLDFVDRPASSPGGTPLAATPVRAVPDGAGGVRLTLSPGRVAPGDPAWSRTRKPVAGEVTWKGRRIIVVANDWYPPTAVDQPAFGRYQPPSRPTRDRRIRQSGVVAGFVRSVRAVADDADVIVAGRLHARHDGEPVRSLAERTGLREQTSGLPEGDRYTAVTRGDAQPLDHVLLSPSLDDRPHEVDVVHRNSEFAARAGEHDPALVRIDMREK